MNVNVWDLITARGFCIRHLRPLESLSTAAPGSTARASSSCTSSSRDFLTVRRALQSRKKAHQDGKSECFTLQKHAVHNIECGKCWHWLNTGYVNDSVKLNSLCMDFKCIYIKCALLTPSMRNLWVNMRWAPEPDPTRSTSTASPCQPVMTTHRRLFSLVY